MEKNKKEVVNDKVITNKKSNKKKIKKDRKVEINNKPIEENKESVNSIPPSEVVAKLLSESETLDKEIQVANKIKLPFYKRVLNWFRNKIMRWFIKK